MFERGVTVVVALIMGLGVTGAQGEHHPYSSVVPYVFTLGLGALCLFVASYLSLRRKKDKATEEIEDDNNLVIEEDVAPEHSRSLFLSRWSFLSDMHFSDYQISLLSVYDRTWSRGASKC